MICNCVEKNCKCSKKYVMVLDAEEYQRLNATNLLYKVGCLKSNKVFEVIREDSQHYFIKCCDFHINTYGDYSNSAVGWLKCRFKELT